MYVCFAYKISLKYRHIENKLRDKYRSPRDDRTENGRNCLRDEFVNNCSTVVHLSLWLGQSNECGTLLTIKLASVVIVCSANLLNNCSFMGRCTHSLKLSYWDAGTQRMRHLLRNELIIFKNWFCRQPAAIDSAPSSNIKCIKIETNRICTVFRVIGDDNDLHTIEDMTEVIIFNRLLFIDDDMVHLSIISHKY